MKAKKKWRIQDFALYELPAMEEYLKQEAAKGWMLQAVKGGFLFVFERTEPSEQVFSAAVIGDMPLLEAEDCDKAITYREYCERAGWRFVCSNRSIQIFCSPAEEERTPIETDEKLRAEAVLSQLRKSIWGDWLSAWFCACIFWRTPIHYSEFLENNISLTLRALGLFGAIFGLAAGLRAFCWYKQAKKDLQAGKNVCFTGVEKQKNKEASLPFKVINFLFLLTAVLLMIQFLFRGADGVYGLAFAFGIGVFQVFLYKRIRKKGFRKLTYALAYLAGICLILIFAELLFVMVHPIEGREQEAADFRWILTSEELGLGPGDDPPYGKQGSSLLGKMQEYESAGTELLEGESRFWRLEYRYYQSRSSWLRKRLKEEILKPVKTRYGGGIRRSFRTEEQEARNGIRVLGIYDEITDGDGRLLEETFAGYLLEGEDSLFYFRLTGSDAFLEEKLLESIVFFL